MAVSTFSFIFGLSQLLLVWNIIRSNRHGEPAGNDPWGGWSLEWMTTSPPPTPSFHDIPTQGDMNELYGHHGSHQKKESPLKKLATPLAKGVEE
jgi:heme/copper-type cytochrome/quinol oxidase subunit 1